MKFQFNEATGKAEVLPDKKTYSEIQVEGILVKTQRKISRIESLLIYWNAELVKAQGDEANLLDMKLKIQGK